MTSKLTPKLLCILSFSLPSLLFAAAPSTATLSLRDKALAEARVDGKTQKNASDAQTTGMLTLKDPRLEVQTRSWSYFAGLTGQNFQSEGVVTKTGSGSFDLGQNSTTLMPGVEVGFLTPSFQTRQVLWKFGLRFKGSFASQETSVSLDSGYQINDARLNTTLLSAGPLMSVQWTQAPRWSFTFSPQIGSLSYTQTSGNDFASFSKNGTFEAFSYGVDFTLTPRWGVFTEWTQRQLKDSTEIALQQDNLELGTRITW
ncbi:MAG: hypothetical protein AAGB31_04440 [Bdellovibrio sp.]